MFILKILYFLSDEVCISEFTNKTYGHLWMDWHVNVYEWLVSFTQLVSYFFEFSNKIGVHNQY